MKINISVNTMIDIQLKQVKYYHLDRLFKHILFIKRYNKSM